MFKNKKMQRLNIILVILLLQACNGSGQTKEKSEKSKTDVEYSIRMTDDKLIIKSADSSVVYNSGNLIRNYDLLNTFFYKGSGNDFFLVYQNNASTTKTQSTYHLFVNNKHLNLISKEQVNLNGDDISIAKNYIIPINVTSMDYETMDEKVIINNKNSIVSGDKLKSNVFFNDENAFELTFKYKPEDFFTDYPVNVLKISTIKLQNIEKSNDIAYYLEEAKIYDEAIFILENIIKKEPVRVVAYLNLADAYWGLENIEKAKNNYEKYISLMKNQKKDLSKIPQRVYERIK